jgi:hypothetical protein
LIRAISNSAQPPALRKSKAKAYSHQLTPSVERKSVKMGIAKNTPNPMPPNTALRDPRNLMMKKAPQAAVSSQITQNRGRASKKPINEPLLSIRRDRIESPGAVGHLYAKVNQHEYDHAAANKCQRKELGQQLVL